MYPPSVLLTLSNTGYYVVNQSPNSIQPRVLIRARKVEEPEYKTESKLSPTLC